MNQSVPVAVVGLGAFTPGASDVAGFWRTVLSGRDMITDVPSSHWLVEDYYDPDPSAPDKTYGRRGAFLDAVGFDPMAFGVPPKSVQATDTTQLLALMVADAVLRDFGSLSSVDREKVSVILGSAPLELLYNMASRLQRPVWLKSLREAGIGEAQAVAICDRIADHYVPWQEASFPGMLSNVVAGRIANRFDLHGTNCTTDAACASSLAAVSAACNELSLGQADLVLTGGVDTLNDILMYMCFSKTPALSPTGDCRPFSASADGTMLGESLVMFALKRLEDAERDGDQVYAVIRGIGTASDGKSTAIYAPLPEGQSRALSRAYSSAGYGPDTVELVEAHGTGTVAGDAAEFAALRAVFASSGRADTQWCALGSVKSQIGHTKAAAGAAGMLKAVLSLHHHVLPPTIKVDTPNPALDLESSPLYLNTAARPWIRGAGHPRRASVSSFGFGGSNFHLALEEYTGPHRARRMRAVPSELVLLSARSADALISAARGLTGSLEDIARRTQNSFDAGLSHRLAIVASSSDDLSSKVDRFAASLCSLPGVCYATGDVDPGSVAFLFPGQGSQYVGMGADVAMHFPEAGAAWDREAHLDLHRTVFPVPVFDDAARAAQEADLTDTAVAQPALALTSLALLEVLAALGVSASAVAGHSFGELVALYHAGVFTSVDLLDLAQRRGELMRDAASVPGAMLAVTASLPEVENALASCTDWWVANHNAPNQVIVSVTVSAMDAVVSALNGFTVQRLNTATAFHSPVVASAAGPLRSMLSTVDVCAPSIPVYGNADGAEYPSSPHEIRERIASHLVTPVRFVDQITAMYAAGVRTFVEVGAGSTVSRLTGQILDGRPHLAVSLDRKGRSGVTSLFEALGQLAVAGVPVDFTALWADAPEPAPQDEKPRMTMPISGANYDRPYPPVNGAAELPPPNPDTAVPEARPATLNGTTVSHVSHEAMRTTTPLAQHAAATPAPLTHRAPATPAPHTHSAAINPMPLAQNAATTPATLTHPAAITPAPLAQNPAANPAPLTQPLAAASAPRAAGVFDPAWLATYQELQRQTAEVHASYQRSLTESHLSYLRATEAALHSLAGAATGTTPATPAPAPNTVRAFHPSAFPAPLAAPEPSALLTPPAAPVHLSAVAQVSAAALSGYAPPAAPSGHAPLATAPAAPSPSGPRTSTPAVPVQLATPPATEPSPLPRPSIPPSGDLQTTLLAVVADKTGYPADMLQPDMELEADLGIDSIKRVEILSTLREQVPGLPDVDAAALGKLRTLGEIAAVLNPTAATPAAATPARPDLQTTLLAVVADKTGYPADMLQPDMELEADLGIDSIKRVEILSTLRERVPGLPELHVAELGKLRTLGEIAGVLTGGKPTPPAPARLIRKAVRTAPAKALGLTVAGLGEGRLVVTDDGNGIADEVVAALAERDVKAEVVTEVPDDADGVIFLGGLRDTVDMSVNHEAFAAAQAVAGKAKLFVTVQDTGGDFGISGSAPDRVWAGGIAGLARCAAHEWPDTAVKIIDCPRDEHTARRIVDELRFGGDTRDVALTDERRTVVTEDEPVADGPGVDNAVIVATGGARGVTAHALEQLARDSKPKLVLIGRTSLRDDVYPADVAELKRTMLAQGHSLKDVDEVLAAREIRQTLQRIEQAGSEVRYEAVDVTDADKLAATLEDVRQEWGPITGIVHGAGVLADKRIADLTDEQYHHVVDTKVKGLRALLKATEQDPITHVCLFSSVAGRMGNVGQSAYAIANEVLNHVASAERAKHPSRKVTSIAWGAWDGGMVTPSLAQHFRGIGVPLIGLDEGAAAFVRELRGGTTAQVVIAPEGTDSLDGHTRTHQAAIHLDNFPMLADHVIDGTPVVPIALALEWFAAATGHSTLQDVSVLRKITDEKISLRGKGNAVELVSDVPHYRAVLGEPRAPEHNWPTVHNGYEDDIYGSVLFHGPRFQAITDVLGVDDNAATATVVGAKELGWDGDHWRTDPAAVDACLQLALVWGTRVFGGNSLPMGVREFRLHRPGLLDGTARCVLRAGRVHDGRAECDVALVDADGAVRAELFGISIVRRPR